MIQTKPANFDKNVLILLIMLILSTTTWIILMILENLFQIDNEYPIITVN